jgi:hypothetical protein
MVCPGTAAYRYSPFAVRYSPDRAETFPAFFEKQAVSPQESCQLPAISRQPSASEEARAKLRRKANGEERKALCFQDFACKPHGLKILPGIPRTELLF